ncbi:MAG: sugar ABC transporter ATP-binding protein [Rhizobium leguminosarum]|nr:sugar ABC transporter ATP-binding protein [Rhizobium leguminosarum]
MDNTILEMRSITKTFPGVKALENVNLKVRQGEIHALVGENGAGKSTLMKVLSGVYPTGSYEGDIVYEGETRNFKVLKDSEEIGIVIIHQELALVPLLSIGENIFLGNENAKSGVISWDETFNRTKQLLKKVGLSESPNTLVTDIGVGKQQLVEIAKALSKSVKLLILDEPTASLNERDSDALLTLLMEFRKQGITSIIISHKLNEIRKVADQITVLRDGMTVKTLDCHADEISEDIIIRNMVGRDLEDRYPPRSVPIGETILEVKNWNAYHQQHRDRQVLHNTTLVNLKAVSNASVIDSVKESRVATDYRSKLRIRSSSIFQEAVNLSGGNQQKVVLSKWLFSDPDILILDEPTRGIDVGAKYEIYTIINQLAADGKGVLMISSEMPELLGTCDRIYVMNEGRIVAELPKGEASQETIMRAIMRSGEKKQ